MSSKNDTKPVKYTLVLIRHGESEWNRLNKFTGWYDADLSDTGFSEARKAGQIMKDKGYEFDIAFTSVLKRAIKTLYHVQDVTDQLWIPVRCSWRLNERHVGDLQGLDKAQTAAKHGPDQVEIWRRSFDVAPPPMADTDERWPGKSRKYAELSRSEIPACESLKDTVARVLSYWHSDIVPTIREGKRVLIVGHGNCLRGLIKYLDNISDDDIVSLNIPTGIPLVYKLDEHLQPVGSTFLAEEAELKAAMKKVASVHSFV